MRTPFLDALPLSAACTPRPTIRQESETLVVEKRGSISHQCACGPASWHHTLCHKRIGSDITNAMGKKEEKKRNMLCPKVKFLLPERAGIGSFSCKTRTGNPQLDATCRAQKHIPAILIESLVRALPCLSCFRSFNFFALAKPPTPGARHLNALRRIPWLACNNCVSVSHGSSCATRLSTAEASSKRPLCSRWLP